MSVNEKMTAIADAIREKTGDTAKLSLDGMAETLRKLPGPIVATASGNPIALTDATDLKLRGLKLFGKTTQDGTPTPEAPVPLVSAGEGGSLGVTIAGKNLFNPALLSIEPGYNTYDESTGLWTTNSQGLYVRSFFQNVASIEAKRDINKMIPVSENTTITIKLYDLVNNIPGSTTPFMVWFRDGEGYSIGTNSKTAQSETITVTTPPGTKYIDITRVGNTGTISFSKIQIEIGSTATEYEPYKAPQTLPVSTPNGLPGIPVTSGGNYTDETGQQWVCDEVDFGRGVYVQRVAKKILNGSEWWIGSLTNVSGVYEMRTNTTPRAKAPLTNGDTANVQSSAFISIPAGKTYSRNVGVSVNTSGYIQFYHELYTTSDTTPWKAFLAENPVAFHYEIDTPIETPLSAEELAAYAALHTNYPNTTILNDGGAGMEVQYVADTKLYIDNKINAMAAAIVNA